MDIVVRSDEDEICRAAEVVESLCIPGGFSPERRNEIRTAVLEALSNAMTHAHDCRPERPIRVRAAFAESALWVEIRDQGPGPAGLPPPPDLERKLAGIEHPRGWGIHLMRTLASEVEFLISPEGHTVRLRFDGARPDQPVPALIRRVPGG